MVLIDKFFTVHPSKFCR